MGIRDAQAKLAEAKAEKIITIGGNCLVSLAPFDYLHGLYQNTGIVWIDAHPDVSTPEDGYPNAHAMVLGSLLGGGALCLTKMMRHPCFAASDLLYIGLQALHPYQQAFLDHAGVNYRVQSESFVSPGEIQAFARRFEHLLVHFDIDVLDETLFHSTYFANKELVGDGSGGGKMNMETLQELLHCVFDGNDVVGLTIAEYLPFDEHRLHNLFSGLSIFTNGCQAED
ncbi:MAG: arginase family protein [Desulfovibrio sp.]|nr:arginase family protein [Desulfovibrio sp.]